MRRISLITVLLLLASIATAQVVVYVNQVTVAWDPVTTLEDGSPVLPTDTVTYEVYRRLLPDGADELVGEYVETQATLTFAVEGSYAIGVRTVRVLNADVLHSTMVWSDVDGQPEPWVVRFLIAPGEPENLRIP